MYGGKGQPIQTKSGVRIVDAVDPRQITIETVIEGKNYRRYIGVKGTKGGTPQVVPLTPALRLQAIKDFQSITAAARQGRIRTVRWEFISAPPSQELMDFLGRARIIVLQYHPAKK